MTERRRLPDRRHSESFSFSCGRLKYTATISRYPNGELAEIFISNTKVGSDSDSSAKDAAVTCSLALQFGVPLDVIRRALLRDPQGRGSTPLGIALDLVSGMEATP
jgi:ribonucleoside-diphosphate reductase alpha chain